MDFDDPMGTGRSPVQLQTANLASRANPLRLKKITGYTLFRTKQAVCRPKTKANSGESGRDLNSLTSLKTQTAKICKNHLQFWLISPRGILLLGRSFARFSPVMLWTVAHLSALATPSLDTALKTFALAFTSVQAAAQHRNGGLKRLGANLPAHLKAKTLIPNYKSTTKWNCEKNAPPFHRLTQWRLKTRIPFSPTLLSWSHEHRSNHPPPRSPRAKSFAPPSISPNPMASKHRGAAKPRSMKKACELTGFWLKKTRDHRFLSTFSFNQ